MSKTNPRSKLAPSKFAHIVLRTNNFDTMKQFYLDFLGASISFEAADKFALLRYDDEHHRVGLLALPDIGDKIKASCGLEHFAYTYDTLEDLMAAYQVRKAMGMSPFWCINHGPTISMYWHDPDGNTIETQFDTLDTDGAIAFMESEAYRVNPVGVNFVPEDLIRRMEEGESLESLIKREDIGPRGLEVVA